MARVVSLHHCLALSVITIGVLFCHFSTSSENGLLEISDTTKNWLARELDEKINQRLTFTCRGLCGSIDPMPCSCVASCLVYDTCCENITQDCPNIIREGREKYSHLFGSRAVCGANKKFKIASCPNDLYSNKTESPFVDVENEIREIVGDSSATSVQLSPSEVDRAMINSPMTDAVSGFTFLNQFTYNCHNSVRMNSKPLYWGLKIESDTSDNSQPSDVMTVNAVTPYEPMFYEINILLPHRCDYDVISSCEESKNITRMPEIISDYFAAKCNEFTGQVVSKRDTLNKKLYRNRFCAYCNEGQHKELRRSNIGALLRGPVNLGVLVSLTQDTTFLLQSRDVNTGTWMTAKCPTISASQLRQVANVVDGNHLMADAQEHSKSNLSCQIEECLPSFSLHSDGRCKRMQYTHIAFSDDPNLDPLVCPSTIQLVAEFLVCTLGLLLDQGEFRYVEFAEPKVSILRDSRTDKKLYVVYLAFASSGTLGDRNSIFAYKEKEILPNLQKISIAIKTLQTFRHFGELGIFKHNTIECASDNITDTIETWDLSEIYKPIDYRNEMVKLRGAVLDPNITSTVCAANLYTASDPSLFRLRCFEDLVYQKDKKAIKDLQNSSCTSLLKDGGLAMHNAVAQIIPLFSLQSFIVLLGFVQSVFSSLF